MLSFLRRLRRKEMKGSKYVQYAIGEIILVVIGILIALQINNWNEERREQKQLKGYLTAIQKNLQTDKVSITIINNRYKEANRNAQTFMQNLLSETYTREALVQSVIVLGEQYLTVDASGFESLKNSGYISKLQGTSLENALFKYYNYTKEIREIETSYNNFVESMEAKFFDESTDNVIDALNIMSTKALTDFKTNKPLAEAIKTIYRNPHMIGAMARASEENTPHYDSLFSYASQLMRLIDQELKN